MLRGERTREATDRKLMQATLQIAVDRGISGVTIEEVARRSGVAKTTIYRRYHNADELLREISAMYLVNPDAGTNRSSLHQKCTRDQSIASASGSSSTNPSGCAAEPPDSATSTRVRCVLSGSLSASRSSNASANRCAPA